MEYISPSMIVRSEISLTKDIIAGHAASISYQADKDRGKELLLDIKSYNP